MSDLKELADYVVEHPEAYEFRWRLAKKLYMAWEYHEALRHLLILKKNWTRKLNVLRYLAATFYRLGRYDEAIAELQGIVAQWPNEVPVWEQLAKVFEVKGEQEQASRAWEEVLRLDPDHSIAGRAVRRLRAGPGATPRDELHLADSDSGINLSTGRTCANCGAQNSEEFDRCWQCHASLTLRPAPASARDPKESPSIAVVLRPLIGGLVSVAAFSGAMYIALSQVPPGPQDVFVPESVYDALGNTLFVPRAAVGAALLLACPLILLGTFRLFRISGLSPIDAFGAGVLIASFTFLLLWGPVPAQRYALGGPALATAFVAALFIPNHRFRSLFGAWIVHTMLATMLGASVWISLTGLAPTREWPAIERYAQTPNATAVETALPRATAPFQYSLVWATSGSAWLDQQCDKTLIDIAPVSNGMPMSVELLADGQVERVVNNPPYRFTHSIAPGKRYTIHVAAPEDGTFQGTVRSVLPVSMGF